MGPLVSEQLPSRPPDWRSRALRRARWPHIDVRDVVIVALLLLTFLFTAHYVNSSQASQQRTGQVIEAKLCTTLDGLRSLQPPPGNPRTNPSRQYLQGLHAKLSQIGSDLGCR